MGLVNGVPTPALTASLLGVCDAAGRCDLAETWARVDDPARAGKLTDFGLGEFAGVESGAGAPLGAFEATEAWCETCLSMASKTSTD